MSGLLTEDVHIVNGIPPVADAFDTTQYSDIVSMKGFQRARIIVHYGVGTTGTQTFTVEACDDTSGSNVSAIPFRYRQCTTGDTPGTLTAATTSGFTTTAGSNKMVEIEVDAAELAASGYQYIRLKSVEVVNSPCLAGVLIELYRSKYGRNTSTTAIV